MSTDSERFHANPEQARYWNAGAGPKWVRNDAVMNACMSALTDELLGRVAARGGERILDVGCGSGVTTARLAGDVGARGSVLGVDISRPMLETARRRCDGLSQVDFEHADAQVHPFPGEGFDRVVSRFGVMFFSDPYAAFRNLARALRPRGRLHFVCWASIERNPWFTVPLEVATRYLGPPEPPQPRAPGPMAFSDPHYIRDILGQAGFRGTQIEPFETAMASPRSAEVQAGLFLEMGPAARLIADRSPDQDTLRALSADLIAALREHEQDGGVSLDATVQMVSAQR